MSFASDFTQFSEFRHISQHSARNLCKMADLAIFSTRIFDGTLCRRAGCPHPAAQGKRIPSPVCTPRALASRRALARNDTGGTMWASSPYDAGRRGRRPLRDGKGRAYRAGRVVRPYKAEQEPCKYGKAPLQLCRRGASAYTQSSMLLRSTATSKGAAVASLI